ncbi:E3 ubiquitin/ISG15 ligase TRIM25-like [Engraulis encrasicolus]|uniref:E3 ubiquitin/ISG15 ligase TRIM25-like n=1 Tax=Engraulis encrasicolus TaxID=184585 RepID=UPI002FD62F87
MNLEKSDSPAPSCVSLKSMDGPRNFTGDFTPNPKVKLEKADSPAPSCVSLKSMDEPLFFKQEHRPPDSRLMKLEQFHSPGLHSVDSEDMKRESITPADFSELAVSLLTNEDFRCSVCTGVLKDPVSIPCGHSYCKQCITSYWEQPSQAGHYACPQCPRTYSSHPALYSNSALALVVHKLEHFSPVLPAQSYAGPGDVECDFCTGRKLKAVKTCLTCTASFCGTHVKEHYTIPALQRHTLVEAVETMEEKMIHTELKESHRSGSDESPSSSRKRRGQEEDPVLRFVAALQQEIRQLKRQVSDLQDRISTFDCKVRKEEKNIREQQEARGQQQEQQQKLAQQLQKHQRWGQQLQEPEGVRQQVQQLRHQLGLRSDPYMWQQLQEEKLTQPGRVTI